MLSLFVAAMGIVDYTSRIGADVLKTIYLRHSPLSESRIYVALVWGLVLCGSVILTIGFAQPLVLLVVSSCVGGLMMCGYSVLLIRLNGRGLPGPIRITPWRTAALVWSTAMFGLLAVLTIRQQLRLLVS